LTVNVTADFPTRVVVDQLEDGSYSLTLLGEVNVTVEVTAVDGCENQAQKIYNLTAECGNQACSPGFWRNHYDMWCATPYNPVDDYCSPGPATKFADAFGITDFSGPDVPVNFDREMTLLTAVNASRGPFNQLLFQGTAALLNASSPEVDYPAGAKHVKRVMRDVFAGRLALSEAGALIGFYNSAEGECGCPFSGGRPTTYECLGDEISCPGDVNGDLVANIVDLAILLQNYGAPFGMTTSNGDIDEDGDVDITDLGILLANFGLNCP